MTILQVVSITFKRFGRKNQINFLNSSIRQMVGHSLDLKKTITVSNSDVSLENSTKEL